MFNKITRKGKNLAEVDNWLEVLGYYRKNVAYDETCLFRAVSEQVSQIFKFCPKNNVIFHSYLLAKSIMKEFEKNVLLLPRKIIIHFLI